MAERRGRRRPEPRDNNPDIIMTRGMVVGRYHAGQSYSDCEYKSVFISVAY